MLNSFVSLKCVNGNGSLVKLFYLVESIKIYFRVMISVWMLLDLLFLFYIFVVIMLFYINLLICLG